ncbi:hypothetical protein COHA_000079 [Chlorella ohadii]|uniref:EGF-like domain-containing protein n=1 Tax=Chlorella ohadii TaxID=2649997 RepID=A0AAD5E0P9_9CHLO|nr:hypothetical protein COHA_000079 [Chlorella ohadii]
MRGAVLAVVLATALVGNAAAAAAPTADSLCEAQGWNVINPEDLAPELLNLTLTAFEAQFIPSESNPDDGQRPVWVPCDQLDAQVEAACEQVEGEVAAYQLRMAVNCTHDAPVPHSDLASFIANVTLDGDREEVSFIDVFIDLDASHTTLPCDDALCALCASDAAVCDVCQPEYSPDPTTSVCAAAPQPAPTSDATAAVGSSTGPARASAKSCPEGQYWGAWDSDGKAVCLDCYRPGCSDCAACDPGVYGPNFCWNGQYCIPRASGGRACLDGYFFKSGGCSLCRITIPNCAFCKYCKNGTAKCINGAQCEQCSPGYKLGPRGYCIPNTSVRRGDSGAAMWLWGERGQRTRCGHPSGLAGDSPVTALSLAAATLHNPQITRKASVSLATGAANMRAALAALLAVALLAAGAAAQGDFCEGEGWEALSPEDVPEEVLNITLTDFNKQYVPSEENPDDGDSPVWVPCDTGDLEVQVFVGCQQVDGEAVLYQLRMGLNCTLTSPLPNSNIASFDANVTMGPASESATFSDVSISLDEAQTRNTECTVENCAACEDPAKCEACMPGYALDDSGACIVTVDDGSALLAAGAGATLPAPSDKSCPIGWYINGLMPYNPDGSVNCLRCTREGCTDCSWCASPPMQQGWCWNNQQCATWNGDRFCLDGYYFKFGGCAQCRITIPNCAFCNACTAGTPRCINGAQCTQCAPGYTLGPAGYCPKA